jgi:hypothetical protein
VQSGWSCQMVPRRSVLPSSGRWEVFSLWVNRQIVTQGHIRLHYKWNKIIIYNLIRKYFCVPLWFMIDSFILPSIYTTNNWVIDYLLLICNLRPVSNFIDPSSGRFGPCYIKIKLQKCMTIYCIKAWLQSNSCKTCNCGSGCSFYRTLPR